MSIARQGSADATWEKLENDLFPILCDQHERVNLFTRSKYGEFERRMDYVDRQARLLNPQTNGPSFQPVQNTRRYASLVQETDRVSEDIQSLSRYVATQKQAFRKILKKYRKWTGSQGLQLRMNEALDRPSSALNLDFMPLLDRLAAVKSKLALLSQSRGNVGEQLAQSHRKGSAGLPPKAQSIASRLHNAFLHSSPLDFDATFLAVPLGMAGGRAAYWVHKDNQEEVTVLLRRYMKDRRGSTPSSLQRNTSVTSVPMARRDSAPSSLSTERTHISMFDNLHRFIKAYGAITVGQAEDLVGSASSILAMSILWLDEPEAVVITSDLSPSAAPTQHHLDVAHLKRKDLVRLFEPDSLPVAGSSQGPNDASPVLDPGLQVHRDWLAKNRDIKPLAEVHCTRSRFAGLNNTSEVGTWALMDMDITMSSIDLSSIGNSAAGDTADVPSFPHTVLEVRWEFSRTPEIVRALDSTHLVERVRGFSIEAHAINAICKSSKMPSLRWQSLLERDIRRVPPVQTRASLRNNAVANAASTEPSSAECPSTGVFSLGAGDSSATSAQGSSKGSLPTTQSTSRQKTTETSHPPGRRPPRRKTRRERQSIQRYWNEFDDGDEGAEDQVYAIYVRPDERISLPGSETVSKAFSSIYQSLGRTKRQLLAWLPMQAYNHDRDHDVEEGARKPLLGAGRRHANDNDDGSSDSDNSPCRTFAKKRPSASPPSASDACRRSLFQSRHSTKHQHAQPSEETVLFRTYVGCYATALVLLVMSAIMKATGRHKAKVQVDAGVLVGVIAALGSATIGISLMISREERLTWLHRALGGGAFLVVCIGSGWLLAIIGGNL